MYIYIYIYRERERDRDLSLSLSLSLAILIYIYIYSTLADARGPSVSVATERNPLRGADIKKDFRFASPNSR